MADDELTAVFLAEETEPGPRREAFDRLVAAYDSPYDKIEFCLRYVEHPNWNIATISALCTESLVFRTLVPQWAGKPRRSWSPAEAAIRDRMIAISQAGWCHPAIIRALAALAYDGIIPQCERALPNDKSFWHDIYVSALGLLSTPESTAVLVRFFRTTDDVRRRREAAHLAAWSELLVEPERSEVEACLLQEMETTTGSIRVIVTFSLALLGNSVGIAEVAALARSEALSTAEEATLRCLTSQKKFGVGSHPDWRPALLDWLRERGA